ncbi:MAG: thioredoxin [Acidobacteria bacterium]|nr:MAG: thioredoxin [Acidobacteriota bacterium]MCE7959806.1 thioredoxin [Acidobacteria bacterium ACB2]
MSQTRTTGALHVTTADFDRTVLSAGTPALVDFHADWCGPCRRQGPLVDELASELWGTAVVAKLDVDENPEIAARYGVFSIPTLLVFKDGVEVERFVGLTPKSRLAAALSSRAAA